MRLLVSLVIRTYRIPNQISVRAYQYRMTKIGSTNISRQKKSTDPRSSRGGAAARAFLYITERSLLTGRIHVTNPQARNSRSQTGTPGVNCTQSVVGGHRESAVHTVLRVPLVVPLPASPAVPSRVQLSSAKMGVLGGGHSSPSSSPTC